MNNKKLLIAFICTSLAFLLSRLFILDHGLFFKVLLLVFSTVLLSLCIAHLSIKLGETAKGIIIAICCAIIALLFAALF